MITRTYLYDENTERSVENTYNFLLENAIGEYFSKIQYSDGHISCYIGDLEFLRISPDYMHSSIYGFKVTTESGLEQQFGYTESSDKRWLKYAYKCKNGIAFSITSATNAFSWAFVITKDNEGNTTIIGTKNLDRAIYGSSTGTIKNNILYVINPKVKNIQPLQQAYMTLSELDKISMCPFVVNCEGSTYTPNVFYVPFFNSSSTCTIDIHGVKYMTNGAWCIKDE